MKRREGVYGRYFLVGMIPPLGEPFKLLDRLSRLEGDYGLLAVLVAAFEAANAAYLAADLYQVDLHDIHVENLLDRFLDLGPVGVRVDRSEERRVGKEWRVRDG